jgi:acyl carrier protein phosphodiesterase
MAREDWLASYTEIEAVDAALNGIARRFRRFARAQALCCGVQELTDNYTALESHFLRFFPELARHAQTIKHGSAAALTIGSANRTRAALG